MKKRFLSLLIFLLIVVSFSYINNKKLDDSFLIVAGNSVSLSKRNLEMRVGGQEKLTVKVNSSSSSKDVVWASNNTKVVTVDNGGNVKAVGAGSAFIIVALRGNYSVKDVCKVVVSGGSSSSSNSSSNSSSYVNVSSVSLNKSSLSLKKGESDSLSVTINPSNATNKKLSWKSSNSSVVSVDSNGKIKANKAGSAIITVASVANSNAKSSCNVTVKEVTTTKKVVDNDLRKLGVHSPTKTLVNVAGDGMSNVHVSQGFCVVHRNNELYLVAAMRNKSKKKVSIQIYKRKVNGNSESFDRVRKFYKTNGTLGAGNGLTYNSMTDMIYVAPSGSNPKDAKMFNFGQSLKGSPSLQKIHFKDSKGSVVSVGAVAYDESKKNFYTGSGSNLRIHNLDRSGISERIKKKYIYPQDIGFHDGKILVVRYNPNVKTDSKSTVSNPRNAIDVYEAGTMRYIGTNIIKLESKAELESVDYYGNGYYAIYYYITGKGRGKIAKIKLSLS